MHSFLFSTDCFLCYDKTMIEFSLSVMTDKNMCIELKFVLLILFTKKPVYVL